MLRITCALSFEQLKRLMTGIARDRMDWLEGIGKAGAFMELLELIADEEDRENGCHEDWEVERLQYFLENEWPFISGTLRELGAIERGGKR